MARAQQPDQMRRIGVLMNLAAHDVVARARIGAFQEALQQLGWNEGRNLRIDYRWSTGGDDELRQYAVELVALAPEAILATGSPPVVALRKATRTVPIVFVLVSDPVGAGFVESLARPGVRAAAGRRTKEATMTIKLIALVLLCLMTGTAMAEEPKVTSLMSKDLPESPGREALMITVEHAPGGSSAIHRHNAHAFVYVLEGSVVMQLKGGQQVTLTPGQSFYEGPDDVRMLS